MLSLRSAWPSVLTRTTFVLLIFIANSTLIASTRSGTIATGTEWETAYHVVDSGIEGPTVLLVGGIHGNEPAGYRAAEQIRHWPTSDGSASITLCSSASVAESCCSRNCVPPSGESFETCVSRMEWKCLKGMQCPTKSTCEDPAEVRALGQGPRPVIRLRGNLRLILLLSNIYVDRPSFHVEPLMKDYQPLDSLLIRTRAGDSKSFNELLKRIRPWVRHQARLLLNPQIKRRLDGSDIAQEVCLRAARAIREFRGTTVPELLAWIVRILRNVVIDETRRQLVAGRDMGREAGGSELVNTLSHKQMSPAEQAVRDEEAIEVAGAIEKLPQHQREIIEARFFHRLSFLQIAEVTGRSEGATRVLCLRAIRRLRDLLEVDQ